MPTNDFLPFATAGGAPVLSQAAYAGVTPANGRGAGILPKEYYNKVARQSSVMAAAIGQFLNANGQNALDDGNIPNLAAAFAAALGGANAPAFFSLRATGGAGFRSVNLAAGTYQCSLESNYYIDDPVTGNYTVTATQSGIVAGGASLTLNSSATANHFGSSGYGRRQFTKGYAVGTLVVPSAGAYTMSFTSAVTGSVSNIAFASILTCERVS